MGKRRRTKRRDSSNIDANGPDKLKNQNCMLVDKICIDCTEISVLTVGIYL